MAKGWGSEDSGAQQMQATLDEALLKARSRLPSGESAEVCDECEAAIPLARREALPGVRLCVPCQEELDRQG